MSVVVSTSPNTRQRRVKRLTTRWFKNRLICRLDWAVACDWRMIEVCRSELPRSRRTASTRRFFHFDRRWQSCFTGETWSIISREVNHFRNFDNLIISSEINYNRRARHTERQSTVETGEIRICWSFVPCCYRVKRRVKGETGDNRGPAQNWDAIDRRQRRDSQPWMFSWNESEGLSYAGFIIWA